MNRHEFDSWVKCMESELNALLSSLPIEEISAFDFSIDSLNVLESYILRNYSSISEMKTDLESHNRFARYLACFIHEGAEIDIDQRFGWQNYQPQ